MEAWAFPQSRSGGPHGTRRSSRDDRSLGLAGVMEMEKTGQIRRTLKREHGKDWSGVVDPEDQMDGWRYQGDHILGWDRLSLSGRLRFQF